MTFGFLTILHVEVLNEHLSLLIGRYVPTKVIRVCNKDKPWFDNQCRHAFGLKQEAHLRWTRDRSRVNWEQFVHCQVRFNETYSVAKRQFSDRNTDVLMNVQSLISGGPLLIKPAVFGSSSSLPPLVSDGGGLVCESVGKADLLSDNFDSKQSREVVHLLLTCHPSPSLTTFTFRWSEVRRLLLDLDPYGVIDPLSMFPVFKRTADVMEYGFWSTVFGVRFLEYGFWSTVLPHYMGQSTSSAPLLGRSGADVSTSVAEDGR